MIRKRKNGGTMKKLLSVLVLLCTASVMANPGFGYPGGGYPGGYPGGRPIPQNDIINLSNQVVALTTQMINIGRQMAGGQVTLQERQALGRLEDLNRTACRYNETAVRLFSGLVDPNASYQLRALQQQLEATAFYARQFL